MPSLFDRVKETATTTGTGTFTLAGAVSGFRSFSVVGNGNTCYYAIVHQSAAEWEVGIGTYTSSGTTLSRDTVLASSNSGNLVNFSSGTKDVFSTIPASIAIGTETRRIPIDLRNPRGSTLAGNSFYAVKALTNIDLGVWEFVKDVEGKIYGIVNIPAEVNSTPNAKIILLIAANATTGVTRLNVATKSVAEDAESINVTLTDDTAQDITVPGTAYLTKKVSFTVGDLANIVANDVLFVEIFHDGDHSNDTLAVNTLLLDAYLEVDVTPT